MVSERVGPGCWAARGAGPVTGRGDGVSDGGEGVALGVGGERRGGVADGLADLDGLAVESRDAVASGFGAKACIHPSQVAAVREAYAPAPEAVEEARELLDAASAAGSGVFQFKGKMIDGPILKHAESVLRRAR